MTTQDAVKWVGAANSVVFPKTAHKRVNSGDNYVFLKNFIKIQR